MTDGPEQAPRNLRAEYDRILRQCTPKQRIWLYRVRDHLGQHWGLCVRRDPVTGKDISRHTVQKWMRNDRIRAALGLQEEMARQDSDVTFSRQEREIKRVAMSNLIDFRGPDGRLLPYSEWTEDMGAAVREVKLDDVGNVIEVKLHPKSPAQATLGKATGYLVDRHELTGPDGEPLSLAVPSLHVHLTGDGDSGTQGD